jgi:hypothetical protein
MADRSRHPGGVNGSRRGVGRLEGCANRVSLASSCYAGVGCRPRRSLKPITQIQAAPNQSVSGSELPVYNRKSLERRRAMRKSIRLAVAAVVTGFLVWVLPAAAHAGIVATGVD